MEQIIEGLMTITVAIISWFVIVDFPDKAEKKGLLTHEEAAFIVRRIELDLYPEFLLRASKKC